MTQEEKAKEISEYYENWWSSEAPDVKKASYDSAMEMAEWKDEQFANEKEGLQEIIDALDARLQKSNDSLVYYFDKCNIQKQQLIEKVCDWLKNNIHDYYVTCEFEQWFDKMYEDLKEAIKKI